MASLQIRDLPRDVYRALVNRARRNGRSLAQQALFELRQVTGAEDRERRRHVIDLLRRRTYPASLAQAPDPVTLVREDRDA